jgi:hypothetical protein
MALSNYLLILITLGLLNPLIEAKMYILFLWSSKSKNGIWAPNSAPKHTKFKIIKFRDCEEMYLNKSRL